jgi:HSP20 family protein
MPETMVPVKATNGAVPRRVEPFAWLDDFAAEMERLWAARPFSFVTGPFPRPFFRLGGREALAWAPRMDVYEKEHAIFVKAELPGLKKEDVQVEVEGDDLVIRGHSQAESEIKQEDYFRTERTYGSFYRRMQLPAGVTPEEIQANLTDGVLEVKIPLPGDAKPETTPIPVN